MTSPSCVALIPLRSGSRRVPGKNVKLLGDQPLCAYTICAALDSGVFADVLVSTDSAEYAEIAQRYGAQVPFLRPEEFAGDTSPDIEWAMHSLGKLREMGHEYDAFSILRVTSPFRQVSTIRRAWARWCEKGEGYDSMRAVELAGQSPWKMWRLQSASSRLEPLFETHERVPAHSRPYSTLPVVYAQNASLEVAWVKTVAQHGSISGIRVLPFFTEYPEGLDINQPIDFELAELLVARGEALLPEVRGNRCSVTASGWSRCRRCVVS